MNIIRLSFSTSANHLFVENIAPVPSYWLMARSRAPARAPAAPPLSAAASQLPAALAPTLRRLASSRSLPCFRTSPSAPSSASIIPTTSRQNPAQPAAAASARTLGPPGVAACSGDAAVRLADVTPSSRRRADRARDGRIPQSVRCGRRRGWSDDGGCRTRAHGIRVGPNPAGWYPFRHRSRAAHPSGLSGGQPRCFSAGGQCGGGCAQRASSRNGGQHAAHVGNVF